MQDKYLNTTGEERSSNDAGRQKGNLFVPFFLLFYFLADEWKYL